ncbi:MAG: hypothetical protein CBD16_09790 [Betaproteobacteria bacterium TMED156]|nr:MAG: hypothetical protein CBD16_09790 [Betaproteobacteria bacterium TMED156]
MIHDEESIETDLRHSRHILLSRLDEAGVKKIRASKILIIGAGGLGCPVAQYMAAAGVKLITWVDPDVVDGSNLPRQVLFGPQNIGEYKVIAGKNYLQRITNEQKINALTEAANKDNLRQWVIEADVVLDCTDQFKTKHLLNKTCYELKRTLVIASAIEWAGQLQVIDPNQAEAACYACIFDPDEKVKEAACGAYGVFSTAVGTMGLLQANEALKIVAGIKPETGRMFLFDSFKLRFDEIRINKRDNCPVCKT